MRIRNITPLLVALVFLFVSLACLSPLETATPDIRPPDPAFNPEQIGGPS